jgi:hypothetical protein
MIINNTAPDLAVELQKIYDGEINIRIGWLWDGGIEIRLGDDVNGYLAEETVVTVADIIPWLQEAIAHFYPSSSYARSLSPELKDRATQRLFPPPKNGAQVICPRCGGPHAVPPEMDEVIAFVCHNCGNTVEVPKAPVQ